MKILVGTPAFTGSMETRTANSLLALAGALQGRAELVYQQPLRMPVDNARNVLAGAVLADPSITHLLFVDADMEFSPRPVVRMLEFDKAVVACGYPAKNFLFERFHQLAQSGLSFADAMIAAQPFTHVAWPKGRLIVENGFAQASAIGTGLMLIQRSVFEKIAEAHPSLYSPADPSWARPARLQCFSRLPGDDEELMGEDFSFCRRWTALGGELWALVDEEIGHVAGPFTFTGSLLQKLQIEERLATRRPSAAE